MMNEFKMRDEVNKIKCESVEHFSTLCSFSSSSSVVSLLYLSVVVWVI